MAMDAVNEAMRLAKQQNNTLRKVLREDAKATPSVWRDIATAPRDGTRVLLLIPYTHPEADIGMWKGDHGLDGCFRFSGDDGPDDINPTHWMPLPEPPR